MIRFTNSLLLLVIVAASILYAMMPSGARPPKMAVAPLSPAQIYEKPRQYSVYSSWYGEAFRDRITASGIPFDPDSFVAASRSLPLMSWIVVTNPVNRRTLRVRIVDRGPWFEKDGKYPRSLDLSEAAAAYLDARRTGVFKVIMREVM